MSPKVYETRPQGNRKLVIAELESVPSHSVQESNTAQHHIRERIAKRAADWRAKHGDLSADVVVNTDIARIVDPAIAKASKAKVGIAKLLGAKKL